MKKIVLFIFVAVFGVMTATAQEIDSLQTNDLSARVDSLTMELKQLRNDHDFLLCLYKLTCLETDLEDISASAISSSNSLMIWLHHSKFDKDLYRSFVGIYNSLSESFNTQKTHLESVCEFVDSKSSTSDFSIGEKLQLSTKRLELYSSITSVQASLAHLQAGIEAYESLR